MNYVGRVMNRAARASQHTKTGQVWCTEKSWEAAERRINSRTLRVMGQMAVHNVGLYADATCRSSASVTQARAHTVSPMVPMPPSASSPRNPPAIPAHSKDAGVDAVDGIAPGSPAWIQVGLDVAVGGTGCGSASTSTTQDAAREQFLPSAADKRFSLDSTSTAHYR
jgi:hypothetical protein